MPAKGQRWQQRKREPHPVLRAAMPAKESGRMGGVKSVALMPAKRLERAAGLKSAALRAYDAAKPVERPGPEPHPYEDGLFVCSRCGCLWQEEGTTDPHECPPGFRKPVERLAEQERAAVAGKGAGQ